MNPLLRLHEDFEISCNVLARLIASRREHNEKALLFKDFLSKSIQIKPNRRAELTLVALSSFTPPDIRSLVQQFELTDEAPSRIGADVAIVTVIQAELNAAKIAFGISLDVFEDRTENGLRFWETAIRIGGNDEEIKVVLTMIGKAGNVECAVACGRVFQTYDVGLCILVGIAAGLKTEVNLGDVVVGSLILDYEPARQEVDGLKKRPTPYTLQKTIERDLNYFNPTFGGWYQQLSEKMTVTAITSPLPVLPNDWKPKFHKGIILAGEKLLADGSLPEMQQEFHNKVRAAEMEGSGFAGVCDEYAIPWLVFRGISDFGDPEKDDTWQGVAALAAATAAHTFLKSDYRRKPTKF